MGNINNTFFNDLANKATWSAGVAFKRSNALPLDKYSVFETKVLAEEYASSNPVAYPGQIITALEGNDMVAYVLKEVATVNENKQPVLDKDGNPTYHLELDRVGIVPTGDGKSIEVTSDGQISLKGVANATAGQQPRIVNKGTAEEPKLELEWYTPDNSTVAGLQDTVGAIKETVDGIVAEDGTVTKEGLTHRVNGLESKVGVAAKPESTEGAGDAVAATGLYKEIADEVARAQAAEKNLDDAIKRIDFVDNNELTEAIKDFTTKKYVDDALALKAGITYVDGEIDKIEEAISNLNHFKAEVVDSLDKVTEVGVLYLIKDDKATGADVYNEYIVVDGKATLIGDTTTDLSNYYNKTEIDGKFTTEKEAREALAEEVAAIKAIDNATQAELDAYKEIVTAAIATAKGEVIEDADGKLATKANAADVYTKDEIAGLNHATKTEVENAVKAEAEIARAAEKANADAIKAIKDSDTIDSFADVVTALAGKQDKLTEGAYATETYVDNKVKALADGAVAEAKAQADKGVADAKAAKNAADEAQADANTNALNIQEIEKTINGYVIGEGDDAQRVDGLITKINSNTTRIGTLEGVINGDAGLVTKVNNIINTELPKKADASALDNTNGRVSSLETIVGHEGKTEGETTIPATGLIKKIADNTSAISALDARLEAEEKKVDNDTTYTFANGTEGKFTVTPKGGTALTVDTGAKTYVDNAITEATKDLATKTEAQGYAESYADSAITEATKDLATKTEAQSYANAKVASVTAGDKSVTIGGTATAPTVAAKLSADANNALTLADDGLKVIVPNAAEYSIVKDDDSGDYAAVYHLTKDGTNVGASINIPKDMVVQSGTIQEFESYTYDITTNSWKDATGAIAFTESDRPMHPDDTLEYYYSDTNEYETCVWVVAEGYDISYGHWENALYSGLTVSPTDGSIFKPQGRAGTYIVLTLANATNDKIYIPASSLIEYVTSGSATGDMVVVHVSDDHKVTATITDGTITLAKLTTDVQTALGKAHNHDNKNVLDGITAAKVTAWDSAEQNAKKYADGIVEQAKNDASDQDAVVLAEAQKYADGLAGNYATATQGAKADTAIQNVEAGTGLIVTKAKLEDGKTEDPTNITIDIDNTVVFVFNGGSASSEW